MADMGRAGDFIVNLAGVSLNSLAIVARIAVPRAMRIVKSYWAQTDTWDGGVAIKLTSALGDLADTLNVTAAGAAGTVNEVVHRNELKNAFAEGELLLIEVTGLSTGDFADVTLVCRPL